MGYRGNHSIHPALINHSCPLPNCLIGCQEKTRFTVLDHHRQPHIPHILANANGDQGVFQTPSRRSSDRENARESWPPFSGCLHEHKHRRASRRVHAASFVWLLLVVKWAIKPILGNFLIITSFSLSVSLCLSLLAPCSLSNPLSLRRHSLNAKFSLLERDFWHVCQNSPVVTSGASPATYRPR